MATTTNLEAVLVMDDDTELPLIPGMTPQQCLDHYSMTYPRLATATVGEAAVKDNKLVYEISETLGTKG